MEVGERIRMRREELNMTQDELAKKVGYTSRSSVAKIESNANGMVQSKLVAFANALQTTPAYLLGFDEQSEKKNDAITDIILKLRTDNDYLEVVSMLKGLSSEELIAVRTFLSAFKQQ
jgi:transcriptional regulator with XRE-family HTH domain